MVEGCTKTCKCPVTSEVGLPYHEHESALLSEDTLPPVKRQLPVAFISKYRPMTWLMFPRLTSRRGRSHDRIPSTEREAQGKRRTRDYHMTPRGTHASGNDEVR